MKFLFFNLAVIGALAYLALKPSPHPESTPADPLQASTPIDQAKAAIEEVKRAAREASQDIKQLVASEIRKVGDSSQKTKTPENDIDPKSGNQVGLQTAPQKVATRTVHKAPQYNASRVPAEPTRPDDTANNAPVSTEEDEETKFMTARERSRELNRLAREMELIFVEKLNK